MRPLSLFEKPPEVIETSVMVSSRQAMGPWRSSSEFEFLIMMGSAEIMATSGSSLGW